MNQIFHFMKTGLVVLAVLGFWADSISAQQELKHITVDFSKIDGPATFRASGFLHSISSSLPAPEWLETLKPKAFRLSALSLSGCEGNAWEACPRIHNMGASMQVLISDSFGYGGQFGIHPKRKDIWPGEGGDWHLWKQCIEELFAEAKKTGCGMQWDIWNEPDLSSFWNPSGDKKTRFFETWKIAWHKIKALDPQAVIVGPSNAYYNNQVFSYSSGLFTVEEFLAFAKANNVLPDILSWHVWHEKDILPTVNQARAYMKAHNIHISRISLNEIVHGDHQNDPGMLVWYFANLEQAKVDSACRACWPDQENRSSCRNATLCNLLTYPDRNPRATWWAYKAYADITGQLVSVQGTDQIAGLAGNDRSRSEAHILLGKKAGDAETLEIELLGLESLSNRKIAPGELEITIQKIPNAGWNVLEQPVLVRQEQVPFSNTLGVTLSDFGASEAYIIQICSTKTCESAEERTVILSAPLTHADWIMRDGTPAGPEGVRYMLDTCKASGWTRIYWRVLDGGLAMYRSKLLEPEVGTAYRDRDWIYNPQTEADKQLIASYGITQAHIEEYYRKIGRIDYSTFDPLAEAVRYGHEIGLEIHAWISINEEDHAWGLTSRYTLAHPESRWVKRDGTVYRSQQSFAFPEVRKYKLAIIEEVLDHYAVDGIFLDWIRTGDVRDNPQNDQEGVADYGYEAPLIESFKAEYGIDPHHLPNRDPRWVAWRAKPQTEFMRMVRSMMKDRNPNLPLAVMVNHPWSYRGVEGKIDDNLRGMLLDVQMWAKEGLIDAAVAAGYYREGGNAEKAYQHLKTQLGGTVAIWLYGWVPMEVQDFETDWNLAKKLGAGQILFWEADYIDGREKKADLQAAMRAKAISGK